MRQSYFNSGIYFFNKIALILLFPNRRNPFDAGMRGVNHVQLITLEFGMPYEGSSTHLLKPLPFSLCTDYRVKTDNAPSCLNEPAECQSLIIVIKYIVVG